MRRYTVQNIMSLRPCQPTEDRPDAGYPEDKLQRLFGDRQSVTLLNICDDARIPVVDRQWVLHRLLPESIVHEAACRYAEHALEGAQARGCAPDPRSWAAIEVKRKWLRGVVSGGELKAAESAAWAVAGARAARGAPSSSWASAAAAAWAAAGAPEAAADAAEAATQDVTRAAEKRWQLATLRAMIEEMEDRTHQRKGKQ